MQKSLRNLIRQRQERNSMSLFFPTRRPRRFHHEMIYCDERKERIDQLKRRVKEEMAKSPELEETDRRRNLRFEGYRQEWRGHRGEKSYKVWGTSLLLLVLLILVMLWIL